MIIAIFISGYALPMNMHREANQIEEFEIKLHSGFEFIYPSLKYEPEKQDLCLIKRRIAVINAMDPLSSAGYSYRKVEIHQDGISVSDKISDTATGGMGTDNPGADLFLNEVLDKMYVEFKADEFRAQDMRPTHPHKTIYGDFIR